MNGRISEPASPPLLGRTALETGASRGIGADVARQLGQLGVNVAINYRSKRPKAEQVANELIAMGTEPLLLQGDITSTGDIAATFDQIKAAWGRLDFLVLDASGGLEQDKPADYAMQLNLTAQVNLVHGALPLMPPGSRIVFVTSHLAHFYGKGPQYASYESVAASKKAGEDALRAMIPSLSMRGIRLVVVSGDLIQRNDHSEAPGTAEPRSDREAKASSGCAAGCGGVCGGHRSGWDKRILLHWRHCLHWKYRLELAKAKFRRIL